MTHISKRILFWTQLYRPDIGGVEILSAQLIAALCARGHEIEVVAGHGAQNLPDESEWEGVAVHRFAFRAALETRNVGEILRIKRKIAALKARFSPQIVHFNLSDPSLFFHLQTPRTGEKTLLTLEVAPPEIVADENSVLGRALREAAWIAARSEAILGDLHRLAPFCAPKSSLIYNGFPFPDLAPSPLPFSPPTILCLGRVVRDKGFDLAISALPELRAQFPEFQLLVAGDGAARPELETLAHALGVSQCTQFLGWVAPENVPQLLNRATVLAVPSRWREAFGLVALQGAQMARPVVATSVGGLPEVVRNGITGMLISPENPAELARALLELLQNPARTTQLGQAARREAQTRFSFAAYVAAHEQLYTRLA